MRSDFWDKYGNVRVLGVVLFVLASVFCLYKIYDLQGQPSDAYKKPVHVTTLKLVSVFGRHGDRAPSDEIPLADKHRSKVDFLWPNGFSNLTDIGRMRQFRIGLELRRRYRDFLSYSAADYLAFSSAVTRCHESLSHTLRGLFQTQWPTERGRKFVDDYNAERSCQASNVTQASKSCQDRLSRRVFIPAGSGSPSEYRNITLDLVTVPTLDWHYLEDCRLFKEHTPPVMDNLMASKSIASLRGINELAKLVNETYKLKFDTTTANLWSTLQEELRLARTTGSLPYGDSLYGWVNERVPGYKPESGVTYMDLWAQVTNFYFTDKHDPKTLLLELGPIVTSLVESQKRALDNRTATASPLAKFARHFQSADLYANKKAVFYSTHDTMLQMLMSELNMTNIEPTDFETRFNKWRRSDDVDRNLAGLKPVEFGASLLLELFETELKEREKGVWRTTKKFPYLQAAFYNEEDVIVKPVAYKRLKLGRMCREKFKKLYQHSPNVKQVLKEKFYSDDFPLEVDYSCPFELFKNVTSNLIISPVQLNDLCGKK